MNTQITLGILGGGQLGRMSAMAAARLGISVIIYCPEQNCPASQVSAQTITAPYDDKDTLKRFSESTDFISYEFENIPVETIDYLNSLKPYSTLPEKTLLDVSQDRIKEKTFLNDASIETARWAKIQNTDDITKILEHWGTQEFILKTTRFGYDGKGQIKGDISDLSPVQYFLNTAQNQDIIMEDLVPFQCEVSVVIARDKFGKTETYGPMRNEHKNHILHKTHVPSGISNAAEKKAHAVAKTIADAVNLTGVLTVEIFVLSNDTILVNEIAPRTHNSGHWSIDACAISQFENHVRTVCGLPVGSAALHSDAMMLNLIGEDIHTIHEYIQKPLTCVHLYGKSEARKGRKMGHITFLKPISK